MTTTMFRALVILAAAVAVSAPVRAQQPPAAPPTVPQAAQPAPPPPAAEQPPASPGGYTYKADGRRDPFVSLLGRASDSRSATNRPTGLAGFLINEVIVTGIVKGGASYVATLRAPDTKTYIVRPGERLMDGTVKSISERQVVFSQDVNDPLSLIKQREITKTVRPAGESME
jgi:Tfp pilus assembly protein PilP